MQTQVLDSLPSMLGLYFKAATKKGHSGDWPPLKVELAGVRPEVAVVSAYDRICCFPESRFLAPTFLHIMAFPLQVQLIVHPDMPLKPMGLVHLQNTIRQYRPVEKGELLHIECTLGESRALDTGGLEFDVLTRIQAGGDLVWEGISTNLSRQQAKSGRTRKKTPPPENLGIVQTWSLPANLGRRYGAVSGDRNPIHLWSVTAKMFGFRQQIIHGMWSKARCLAALMPEIGERAFEISVGFKTPVYLPARVEFSYDSRPEGFDLLFRSTSGKPHMIGKVTFL